MTTLPPWPQVDFAAFGEVEVQPLPRIQALTAGFLTRNWQAIPHVTHNDDADIIHGYLNEYCAQVPSLTVVRNDVYARFSHAAYSKGTALSEIARRLDISSDLILAAGDHLNDLPMLSREHARWLVAPSNAIARVKEAVRRQDGFVSDEPHGLGVARGVQFFLRSAGAVEISLNSKA